MVWCEREREWEGESGRERERDIQLLMSILKIQRNLLLIGKLLLHDLDSLNQVSNTILQMFLHTLLLTLKRTQTSLEVFDVKHFVLQS